jgi:diguanylate cyclase
VAAHEWAGPWQDVLPGKPALARDWAQAVTPFARAGTARPEVELHLRRHLETLHDALLVDPADTAAAERIGAALVALTLDDPAAVGVTLTVLGDRLLAELGLDEVTFAGPLHTLLGALATGYARALTQR